MARMQILVVDDERIVAQDIRSRLERMGYAVAGVAASGEEALERAAQMRPDLALMDIMLKGQLDGIETAEELRQCFDIPVVYVTAYADDATLERAKITEPFGFILKPFEERDLRTAIEIALYKHRIEHELRESRQWLATTLKSIGDAVIATDTHNQVTFMNPVAESLTGWKADLAKGKPLSEVFRITAPDAREAIQRPLIQPLPEGMLINLVGRETTLLSRDGRELPIDHNVALVKDEQGAVSGVVVIFRDITERKRVEEALFESEEQYRMLFESNPCPMWVYDRETFAFLAVNDAALRLYGYARKEFLGMTLDDLHLPEDLPRFLDLERSAASGAGPASAGTWRHRKKDGTLIEADMMRSLIPCKGRPGALVLAVPAAGRRENGGQGRGKGEVVLPSSQRTRA